MSDNFKILFSCGLFIVSYLIFLIDTREYASDPENIFAQKPNSDFRLTDAKLPPSLFEPIHECSCDHDIIVQNGNPSTCDCQKNTTCFCGSCKCAE